MIGYISRCATSDGKLVVAGVESGELVVWDLMTMECVQSIKLSQSKTATYSLGRGRGREGGVC